MIPLHLHPDRCAIMAKVRRILLFSGLAFLVLVGMACLPLLGKSASLPADDWVNLLVALMVGGWVITTIGHHRIGEVTCGFHKTQDIDRLQLEYALKGWMLCHGHTDEGRKMVQIFSECGIERLPRLRIYTDPSLPALTPVEQAAFIDAVSQGKGLISLGELLEYIPMEFSLPRTAHGRLAAHYAFKERCQKIEAAAVPRTPLLRMVERILSKRQDA